MLEESTSFLSSILERSFWIQISSQIVERIPLLIYRKVRLKLKILAIVLSTFFSQTDVFKLNFTKYSRHISNQTNYHTILYSKNFIEYNQPLYLKFLKIQDYILHIKQFKDMLDYQNQHTFPQILILVRCYNLEKKILENILSNLK